VVEDEGFQLPTEPARAAVKCAEGLLEWISYYHDMAASFEFLHAPKKFSKRSVQQGREKIWEGFLSLHHQKVSGMSGRSSYRR
jgi:hypothetical protein